jgi:hypothetical protein
MPPNLEDVLVTDLRRRGTVFNRLSELAAELVT